MIKVDYDPSFLKNQYGTFSFNNDILPDGFHCVSNDRLLDGRKFPKNLNIPYVVAVHGWTGRNSNRYRKFMRPAKVGIIVHKSFFRAIEGILGEPLKFYNPE